MFTNHFTEEMHQFRGVENGSLLTWMQNARARCNPTDGLLHRRVGGEGCVVSAVSEIDQPLTQRLGNTKIIQQWKE